jgi:hypothetical protein
MVTPETQISRIVRGADARRQKEDELRSSSDGVLNTLTVLHEFLRRLARSVGRAPTVLETRIGNRATCGKDSTRALMASRRVSIQEVTEYLLEACRKYAAESELYFRPFLRLCR